MASAADAVAALYAQARAAFAAGDHASAGRLLREVAERRPDHAGALQLLGILAMGRGQVIEAEALFARALAHNPGDPNLIDSHATALQAQGRHDEALAGYERALECAADFTGALAKRAHLLRQLGRQDEALSGYERLVALQPGDAERQWLRAETLHDLGRHDEAVAGFDRVLALRPDALGARFLRGNACWHAGRLDEALADYGAVIAAEADSARARANRSVVLIALGRPAEALADIEAAVRLKPDHAEYRNLLGNALHALNRHDEAVAAHERALALDPAHAQAAFNISMCRFAQGDLARAWPQYESRWKTGMNLGRLELPQPLWDGGALRGTLLLWAEQGIGDQIMQMSLIDSVLARTGNVVFAAMPRLLPLLRRSYPAQRFIALADAAREPCAAQSPLWSAAAHLRRSLADFPVQRRAYLRADAARSAVLRARRDGDDGLRVGLSWRSRSRLFSNPKSMPLAALEPLLRLPSLRFIDLQYGDTAQEREALHRRCGVELLRADDIDPVNDIDGLAALVSSCDVVVTISNVTAHLAGALGVPALLLLPWSSGRQWYWQAQGECSPWYPALRLIRQSQPLRWDDAVARAGEIVLSLKPERR